MVRSFRRWYRRRYGRRSYSRFRRYRRRYKRFINSSSKSRVRVKIPVTVNATMTVPANSTVSNVISVSPFYGNTTQSGAAIGTLLGDVFGSPLFAAYQGLYDQVKCDGFKLNFSITSGIGPGGVFPSLSIYTSVDRKLNANDFAESITSQPNSAHYPVASELKNSSTYLSAVALNNSVTKMVRSCYASDLFEKASFADASQKQQLMKVNAVANQSVRCFAGTDPSFVPCMYFACDTGSSVDTANSRDCAVVIEIMYYLTFRNPKYGGGGLSSAKTISVPRGPIFPDDDGDMDGEDDMDIGGDMDAGAAQAAADTALRSALVDRPSVTSRLRAERVAAAQADPIIRRKNM